MPGISLSPSFLVQTKKFGGFRKIFSCLVKSFSVSKTYIEALLQSFRGFSSPLLRNCEKKKELTIISVNIVY